MEVSIPSTTTGGTDQLRGTEHVHDRSIKVQERAAGQGIMLSPIRDPVAARAGSTAGGIESQGLTALAQTIIGSGSLCVTEENPVGIRGIRPPAVGLRHRRECDVNDRAEDRLIKGFGE